MTLIPPAKPLGLLRLDEPEPASYPSRCLGEIGLFPQGMISEVVEAVSVPDILHDLPHVKGAYLRAARRLEERGSSAIISNCGYSVLYQEAIASAVSVPTLASSLLLLPLLAAITPVDQKIGIICFDSTALSDAHLWAAWPQADHQRIVKVGIEQTDAWKLINRADAIYDWDLIGTTLNRICETSLLDEKLGAVIVECCAFSAFIPQIQRLLQRPTFDIVSTVNALLPQV
ncbi:hypothetical protein [Mesorhizobium sp. 43Arga]